MTKRLSCMCRERQMIQTLTHNRWKLPIREGERGEQQQEKTKKILKGTRGSKRNEISRVSGKNGSHLIDSHFDLLFSSQKSNRGVAATFQCCHIRKDFLLDSPTLSENEGNLTHKKNAARGTFKLFAAIDVGKQRNVSLCPGSKHMPRCSLTFCIAKKMQKLSPGWIRTNARAVSVMINSRSLYP